MTPLTRKALITVGVSAVIGGVLAYGAAVQASAPPCPPHAATTSAGAFTESFADGWNGCRSR